MKFTDGCATCPFSLLCLISSSAGPDKFSFNICPQCTRVSLTRQITIPRAVKCTPRTSYSRWPVYLEHWKTLARERRSDGPNAVLRVGTMVLDPIQYKKAVLRVTLCADCKFNYYLTPLQGGVYTKWL